MNAGAVTPAETRSGVRDKSNQTESTIRSSLLTRFFGIFGVLGLYLFLAADAFAQRGGAERVGENFGDLLGSIGQYVTLSIAGIIALTMIIARKFSNIGGLLVMVFLVMSLFVSGDEWARMIENTMRFLSRGA